MPGGSTSTGVTPGITPVFGFPPGLASNETYRFRNREWPNTTTPNFIVHNYVGWNPSGINNYSFASSTGGTPVGVSDFSSLKMQCLSQCHKNRSESRPKLRGASLFTPWLGARGITLGRTVLQLCPLRSPLPIMLLHGL